MPLSKETLAIAAVEITADRSHYDKGVKAVKGSLTNLGHLAPVLLKGVGVAFAAVGTAAAAAGAAITAISIKGAKDYAGFGNEMARVSTMVRTNVDANMRMLAAGVRELSTEVPQ